MLSWFVDKCVAESALHGKLIEENEVECCPEKVPNALLDENVNINLIQLCFIDDAWMIVDSVLQQKVQRPNWLYHSCNHNLAKQPSIIRDSCLQWNHLQCVGLSGHAAKAKTLVLSFLPLVICCDFQYSLHVCIYKHLLSVVFQVVYYWTQVLKSITDNLNLLSRCCIA